MLSIRGKCLDGGAARGLFDFRSRGARVLLRALASQAIALCAVLLFSAKALSEGNRPPLKVVATTTFIADLVRIVGGPEVVVQTLMGPGVDPHLYRPTFGDLAKLREADVLVAGGLHLEGKMEDAIRNLEETKKVILLGEGVPKSLVRMVGNPEKPDKLSVPDPHIWFDVSLWQNAGAHLVRELASLDYARRYVYDANFAKYRSELDDLHSWARAQIEAIPKEQRVLVTAHDAFEYFGRAYNIEVRGLQGISTATEYGLADVQAIVDLIIARKVKAIFVETSVPTRFVESVQQGVAAKGGSVALGGTLYSDSAGPAGTPEATYIGMVRSNVSTIVAALK